MRKLNFSNSHIKLFSTSSKIIKAFRNVVYDAKNPLGKKIKRENLTYLSKGALYNIVQCIRRIQRSKTRGIFVEAGCALGGSTIQIGLAKKPQRKLKVYDVFGMIPPPTEKDDADVHDRYSQIVHGKSKGIRGDLYYGYEEDLMDKVESHLEEFGLGANDNIHLIKGLYEETMEIKEPVAFAHIDCDWYSSVITCLENIEPWLADGGIIIVDDYYEWSGCRNAVDDYFEERNSNDLGFSTRYNKLIISKD